MTKQRIHILAIIDFIERTFDTTPLFLTSKLVLWKTWIDCIHATINKSSHFFPPINQISLWWAVLCIHYTCREKEKGWGGSVKICVVLHWKIAVVKREWKKSWIAKMESEGDFFPLLVGGWGFTWPLCSLIDVIPPPCLSFSSNTSLFLCNTFRAYFRV